MDISLIAPSPALHASWLEARTEWGGPSVHQPGAAIAIATALGLDLSDPVDFGQWVDALNAQPALPVTEALVPATNWWITNGDDRYLGAIQLRHQLNARLADLGGHIGYGVRPTARRKGITTTALLQVLAFAEARLGLREVLITCETTNAASRRTIEAAGGELQSVRRPDEASRALGFGGELLRYLVPTGTPLPR